MFSAIPWQSDAQWQFVPQSRSYYAESLIAEVFGGVKTKCKRLIIFLYYYWWLL